MAFSAGRLKKGLAEAMGTESQGTDKGQLGILGRATQGGPHPEPLVEGGSQPCADQPGRQWERADPHLTLLPPSGSLSAASTDSNEGEEPAHAFLGAGLPHEPHLAAYAPHYGSQVHGCCLAL